MTVSSRELKEVRRAEEEKNIRKEAKKGGAEAIQQYSSKSLS